MEVSLKIRIPPSSRQLGSLSPGGSATENKVMSVLRSWEVPTSFIQGLVEWCEEETEERLCFQASGGHGNHQQSNQLWSIHASILWNLKKKWRLDTEEAHLESQHSQQDKGRGRRLAISLRLAYLTWSKFQDNLAFNSKACLKKENKTNKQTR